MPRTRSQTRGRTAARTDDVARERSTDRRHHVRGSRHPTDTVAGLVQALDCCVAEYEDAVDDVIAPYGPRDDPAFRRAASYLGSCKRYLARLDALPAERGSATTDVRAVFHRRVARATVSLLSEVADEEDLRVPEGVDFSL